MRSAALRSPGNPNPGGIMTDRHDGLSQPGDPRTAAEAPSDAPPAQQQEWPGREGDMRPAADHGESAYRGAGKLTGRRALITGGDSGIGRAVAIAFAREGADVAVTYYDEHDDAKETARWVRDAGRRAVLRPADLAETEACRQVVDWAVAELGGLDILVNNAAYQMETDFDNLTTEQIERTFRTNILAYIHTARAALRHMGAGGVILNTGSVTAMQGHATLVDYAATKGAIHSFTRSLAQAVAERGVRVNCVAPGPVWTPLIPATLEPDHVGRFGQDTLWGRAAQPAEIAPTYVFLASDDGRYYSGEVFAPTGRAASR
jgi:NAD(P)-dependent dehydrogenase (short-subunit alcohol dehydrogenase family)